MSLISSRAEPIVTDHLAPALAEVVEEAPFLADLVSPFGTNPEQILRAPDDVRTALLVLRDLADRHQPLDPRREPVELRH